MGKSEAEKETLQRDLDLSSCWNTLWSLSVNASKCAHLPKGKKSNAVYYPGQNPVRWTLYELDLRVVVSATQKAPSNAERGYVSARSFLVLSVSPKYCVYLSMTETRVGLLRYLCVHCWFDGQIRTSINLCRKTFRRITVVQIWDPSKLFRTFLWVTSGLEKIWLLEKDPPRREFPLEEMTVWGIIPLPGRGSSQPDCPFSVDYQGQYSIVGMPCIKVGGTVKRCASMRRHDEHLEPPWITASLWGNLLQSRSGRACTKCFPLCLALRRMNNEQHYYPPLTQQHEGSNEKHL